MSAYFFDSSALNKRYVYEAGSNWVRAICEARQERPTLCISQLTRVEIIAALYRMGRVAHAQDALVDAAVAAFERHLVRSQANRREDLRPYILIPLGSQVVELASVFCRRHRDLQPFPLRALDALQLASAFVSRQLLSERVPAGGDSVVFVSADSRLLAIAASEGFAVENPILHP